MKPSSTNKAQSVGVPLYSARAGGSPYVMAGAQHIDTAASIAMTHPALQGNAQPQVAHAQPNFAMPNNQSTFVPPGRQNVTSQSEVPLTATVSGPGMPPGTNPGVKPVANTNPNSTQNMLQFAEIRDGIIIMNDGSFRSIVMAKSINFDLMSQGEQESVEYNYQGFLNSLNFPIQIFVRSSKVDLTPYIERLEKIKSEHDNMLLAMLMEDYIGFIDQISQQTNIMDKRFYVVIPFFPTVNPQKALTNSKNFMTGIIGMFNSKEQHVVINEADLQKAKTELRNRVQSVLSGLMQCGVQGLPLATEELIELLYDTYNPDTATRQPLKKFGNLTADVVGKGKGMAPQRHLSRELDK